MWGRKTKEEPVIQEPVIQEPVAPPPQEAEQMQEEEEAKPRELDPLTFSPPKFDELTKESKEVLGTHELFDGFRFDFTKFLSDSLSISHSFGMGSSSDPATYHFGTGYATKKGFSMHGRVDTEGSVQGRFHHNYGRRISYGFMSQATAAPHGSGLQFEGEFRGNTWNASARFSNPSGVGLSYTQSVVPGGVLGVDILYSGKQGISMVNGGFRFEKGDLALAGLINPAMMAVSFSHKLFNQAVYVTELQTSWAGPTLDTNFSIGTDYMLRTSHLKARIDSNRKVTCYLEEMLNQHTRFTLSAELDHKKKSYKFGFGVGMAI